MNKRKSKLYLFFVNENGMETFQDEDGNLLESSDFDRCR